MKLYDVKLILEQFLFSNEFEEDGFSRLPALTVEMEMDREEIILQTAAFLKGLEVEIDAHEAEMKAQKEAMSLKQTRYDEIAFNLLKIVKDDDKLQDARCSVSVRKSESVEIGKDLIIDILTKEQYMRCVPEKHEWDKNKLKTALKQGIYIEGVELRTSRNLQIK